MLDGTRAGRIEVIAGVMFSGKSEELIRRVRRAVIAKNHVQVFKSHLDARYAGLYSISTHDGGIVEAEPVDSSEEIITRRRRETQVLAVDEVQFLDDGIVTVANTLADQGVRIVLAGIDMDFRGLPFGPMPALLPSRKSSTSSRRSAWCAESRRVATSGSSTAGPPCGTVPRLWSGGGSRTRRGAGNATRFRGRMRIRRRCSERGTRNAERGTGVRLALFRVPPSAFRLSC